MHEDWRSFGWGFVCIFAAALLGCGLAGMLVGGWR